MTQEPQPSGHRFRVTADGRLTPRVLASAAAALFLPGLFLDAGRTKEEVVAISTGVTLLLATAWLPSSWWPRIRVASGSCLALFLAFAGIVGLAAPDATASWLFGAGLAGLSRIWIDALITKRDRDERAETIALLQQIASSMNAPPPSPRQPSRTAQGLVAVSFGVAVANLLRRRRRTLSRDN